MIIKCSCDCGNEDTKDFHEYYGYLGYEAVICRKCGKYYDHEGKHNVDQFSIRFLNQTATGRKGGEL